MAVLCLYLLQSVTVCISRPCLNHTVTYDISSAPALSDTLALETAGLVQSSAGHQMWLSITFDSLLVNYLHEEALLVHIPAVYPVLGCPLVQQPVHKRCMRLSIAVDPGDSLQA